MQRNMWDRKEGALNRRLEALAAREDWEGVLRELDQYDANNERRHQEHRDDFDLALLDGRSCEEAPYQIPRRLCGGVAGHHLLPAGGGSAGAGIGISTQRSSA